VDRGKRQAESNRGWGKHTGKKDMLNYVKVCVDFQYFKLLYLELICDVNRFIKWDKKRQSVLACPNKNVLVCESLSTIQSWNKRRIFHSVRDVQRQFKTKTRNKGVSILQRWDNTTLSTSNPFQKRKFHFHSLDCTFSCMLTLKSKGKTD
jgi:hypothetical protein